MSSAYWLAQIRGISQTLEIKRNRLEKVNKVLFNLGNNYTFDVSDINQCLTFSLTDIGSAIKKNDTFCNNVEDVVNFYQADPSSDSKLSSAITYLNQEASKVERDIEDAEIALQDAQRNYEQALREEEEERKRQEEEAKNKRSN